MLIDAYRVARKLPVTRSILRLIGPLLHAVAAVCQELLVGQPGPAPRPRDWKLMVRSDRAIVEAVKRGDPGGARSAMQARTALTRAG